MHPPGPNMLVVFVIMDENLDLHIWVYPYSPEGLLVFSVEGVHPCCVEVGSESLCPRFEFDGVEIFV